MATGLSLSLSHSHLFPISTRRKMPRATLDTARSTSYWSSTEADLRTYLENAIPIRPPKSVFEPMRHITLAAPPNTASSLCLAACELVGGDRYAAIAAAAAVHLLAAAAHVHERLPLSGQSGSGHAYGPNIELLTGDGIVPFGLELVAKSMRPGPSHQDKVVRVIIEISRAGGSQGVVDGQYRELGMGAVADSERENVMEYVCRKKEGELHGCGAACGAILGGGSEVEIEGLRRFGVYAGTVRGLLATAGKGRRPGAAEQKIERLRGLALKELDIFHGKKLARIVAGLVEPTVSLSV